MKTTSILIAACALLAGCAGQKHVEIQRVKVPVPVECREVRLRAALLICTAPVAAKPAEGAQ